MHPPFVARDNLILAALRLIKADHYAADDDPYADDEAGYAAEQLADRARDLVAALDGAADDVDRPARVESDAQRGEFIKALRDLARFLADRPGVPVPRFESLTVFPRAATDAEERAMVDAAAEALGTTAAGDTHYGAELTFGPLTYEVVTVARQHMADYHERNRLGEEAFEAKRETAAAPNSGPQ